MSKKIQSVERALNILEYVVNQKEGASLSEISIAMGLHTNTAYNLAQTLVEDGYLSQQHRRQRYEPGPKLFEIAGKVLNSIALRDLARPYLEELHKNCDETIHLGVRHGEEALDIDVLQSSRSVRLVLDVGHRMPLYCSAVGKVLLASLDPTELDDFLKARKLKRYTRNTITDPIKLKDELEKIRRTGIAFNRGEYEEGIRCIAAPIMNSLGKVIAAVSISCPESRFTESRLPELILMLKKTTGEISAKLGYNRSE